MFLFLFSFFQLYTLTAIPKSLQTRPSKKVETYVQGCVPIYLNTILSYAYFISVSDHLKEHSTPKIFVGQMKD